MAGGVYGMFGAAAAQSFAPGPAAPHTPPAAAMLTAADWDASVAAAPALPKAGRTLDLVFVMDATGSMGSYIREATRNIEAICDTLIAQSDDLRGPDALRIALIAYRDHPPQDRSYVTKTFPFTTSVPEIKQHLHTLYASGGGDGPEAVTAAMAELVALPWRPSATKLAVLITDAPPHGAGETGDGFPNGSPDGHDPLSLARMMAHQGIGLLMVACEPALSSYRFAVDFFRGLVQITGGTCVPLTTASLLSHVIVAAAAEAMDMERLHRDVGDELMNRLHDLSLDPAAATMSLDAIARELHSKLLLRQENTKQLYLESIYNESTEADHNCAVFAAAQSLSAAKPQLLQVSGTRLNASYLSTRKVNTTTFRPPAMTPPRPAKRASAMRTTFDSYSVGPGLSASFSPASASAAGSTPGLAFSPTSPSAGGSSIRAQRPQAFFDSDDEDDIDADANVDIGADTHQDGSSDPPLPVAVSISSDAYQVAGADGQKLFFGQGPLSLDQARRLAWQSARRSGLAA